MSTTNKAKDAPHESIVRDCAELLPRAAPIPLDHPAPVHVTAVAVPHGQSIEVLDLERYHEIPRLLRQRVDLRTPEDLAHYVNAYASDGTRLFADAESRTIEAVMDYHIATLAPGGAPVPRRCLHRASCVVRFDPAFDAWRGIEGEIGQRDFAEFLEDRAEDAELPGPADLLEVAHKFEALRKVSFRSAVSLKSGTHQFLYQEEDSVAGAVEMPRAIRLRTPVLEGQAPRQWAVRFGYRIDNGALLFRIRIHRHAELVADAWRDQVAELRSLVAPPVHVGTLAG